MPILACPSARGENPEVTRQHLVDEVELHLVGEPAHVLVIAPQGHRQVPAVVPIYSSLAGDDGIEAVAPQDEAGAKLGLLPFVSFTGAAAADAAHGAVLDEEIAHRKALDTAIGRGASRLEEKGIQHLPTDDESLHRQQLSGEQVAVDVTPEIDVGVDVSGTAEDKVVDRGPRKLSDAIQQVELVQDGNGLTGEGVPADLVPGEPLSVQEQRPQPAAAGEEGGSRTGWATAHDDEIVHLVVGVAHVLFGGRIGPEDDNSKAGGWSQWR